MARTSDEEQQRRRRRRIARGLLLGTAAVGIPAIVNSLLARRTRSLESSAWGRSHRYAWTYGEVAFQRIGEGPQIILAHSLGPGHDGEEWRAAAEILARSHRVWAVDLLGWGRSDKPAMAYDGELYIQLLTDFLSDVVRERSTLVAAGLSAAYAVQVGIDAPDLVRGVALCGPAGIEAAADEPDLRDALVHRLLRLPLIGTSALNLATSQAALAQHLRRDTFATPERVDAAMIEHYHRSSHQPGSHHALAAYLCGFLNHPVRDVLPRLSLPVWIGWGRQATAPPVETADLWMKELPDAELEVLEGCGNLPHAEAPGRLAGSLARFVAELVD